MGCGQSSCAELPQSPAGSGTPALRAIEHANSELGACRQQRREGGALCDPDVSGQAEAANTSPWMRWRGHLQPRLQHIKGRDNQGGRNACRARCEQVLGHDLNSSALQVTGRRLNERITVERVHRLGHYGARKFLVVKPTRQPPGFLSGAGAWAKEVQIGLQS